MSPIFSIFINRLAEDLERGSNGTIGSSNSMMLMAQEGDMQRMLDMAYECSK